MRYIIPSSRVRIELPEITSLSRYGTLNVEVSSLIPRSSGLQIDGLPIRVLYKRRNIFKRLKDETSIHRSFGYKRPTGRGWVKCSEFKLYLALGCYEITLRKRST